MTSIRASARAGLYSLDRTTVLSWLIACQAGGVVISIPADHTASVRVGLATNKILSAIINDWLLV
jgi:hypothetical protein